MGFGRRSECDGPIKKEEKEEKPATTGYDVPSHPARNLLGGRTLVMAVENDHRHDHRDGSNRHHRSQINSYITCFAQHAKREREENRRETNTQEKN